MIDLRLLNGFGNILFQYAYARILAETKSYALAFQSRSERLGLQAQPSPEVSDAATYYPALKALFENFSALDGHNITSDPLFVITPNVRSAHEIPDQDHLIECDQRMDLADHDRLLRHQGRIVIHSWLQDYKLLRPHKDNVRRIYHTRLTGDVPRRDQVVMHIRLGDYVTCCNTLPLEYYRRMVRRFSSKEVVCVTDSPDHFYIEALTGEPNFSLYDGSGYRCPGLDPASEHLIADFLFMLNTPDTLVLSNSTFAWWAAFLSPARHVIHPLIRPQTRMEIKNGQAMTVDVADRSTYDPYWILGNKHPSQPDLFVDDESRWESAVF